MDNLHKEGDVVYAKTAPDTQLIVRRYLDRIYYCVNPKTPEAEDLVYFERELLEDPILENKN